MASRTTVVFILSTRRAGSTWLNMVLGAHSWAANLGEYMRIFTELGHVACRLCEAEGRAECTVLHGIEHVDRADAFGFAAERLPGRVLVDASKRPEWCTLFVGRDDIDARLVHLVRHPAGFIESQSRRTDLSYGELIADWEFKNTGIDTFIERSGEPSMLVSYEDLADDPECTFPRLCEFAGGAFEPDALRYWDFPHHGLGANGAASLYLRGRQRANYTTGDDAYYDTRVGVRSGADTRWMERVPADVVRRAIATPYAKEMARRVGRPWELPTPRSRSL